MTEDAVKNLDCFIIMPFVKAEVKGTSLDEKKLTYIYENFFCKAIKSYNKNNISFANVSRYDSSRGNFIKGIVGSLNNADLVLADLSGLNPNVFYELGIRHTLKNGTILLTQDIDSLPADLKNYIAFEYKYPDISEQADYYHIFEEKLHNSIDEFVTDMDKADNPVKDFLGVKHIIKDEERKREILTNISLFKLLKIRYFYSVSELILFMFGWQKGTQKAQFHCSLGVTPILNRMVLLGEKITVNEFLYKLVKSEEMINKNQIPIKLRIEKEKEIKNIREVYCTFVDRRCKSYHILDLMDYYELPNKEAKINEGEPIVASFDYFIQLWRNELHEINS